MKKLGILGATFNPVHKVHIEMANKSVELLQLDKCLLVPTNISYHKNSINLEPKIRLEMLELAIKNNKKLEISTVDIERGGNTYTIDTLTDLKKIYNNYEFYFIMGSDTFNNIMQFKQIENILNFTKFVVFTRKNEKIYFNKSNIEKNKIIDDIYNKTIFIDIDLKDISSTFIRRNCYKLCCEELYLDENVYNFIIERELYAEYNF